MRGHVRTKLLWAIGLTLLILMLASCAEDLPQNTFDPAGPTAQQERDVLIPPLIIAGLIFVLVEGGILLIAVKFRHRKDRERMPKQIHGNTRLEIGWTIAPAILLAIVFIPAISLIWKLAETPSDAMQVTVQGYQWWWGFQYTDEDMRVNYGQRGPITVADVLVIPAQRTVNLTLVSEGGGAKDAQNQPDAKVIHSFWAPRLFGKQDVVPGLAGQSNHIYFSADEPGTYYGQCAEFCGLQHGMMKFRIVALSETDWEAWVAAQRQPAATPTDPLAVQGMDLFLNGQCIACHAVGGTQATSPAAPNLTRFADPTHECFAGCDFETFLPDGTPNVTALKAWLENPDAVKMGAKMPDYNLTDEELDALVAYLYSLT
jgi:cytochrome c oxidase subunit 2